MSRVRVAVSDICVEWRLYLMLVFRVTVNHIVLAEVYVNSGGCFLSRGLNLAKFVCRGVYIK